MGLGVHNGVQLYMRGRQQCDDMSPKKKISFCFNHPRDPVVGLRSRTGWKFKIF
jgi:hypothetical protein